MKLASSAQKVNLRNQWLENNPQNRKLPLFASRKLWYRESEGHEVAAVIFNYLNVIDLDIFTYSR